MMLAHGESTKNMDPMEYLGNLILLIVGGNDTTRNSISGGGSIPQRASRRIRETQSQPESHSQYGARNYSLPNAAGLYAANHDETCDHRRSVHSRGERILMWYASGNLDERAIDNGEAFLIDRARSRSHLSFGFGIHRCMGVGSRRCSCAFCGRRFWINSSISNWSVSQSMSTRTL